MKACLDEVPLLQIQRCVILSFNVSNLTNKFYLSQDMQINQLALLMPIHRARPDRLPFGQTENIMGARFLPKP